MRRTALLIWFVGGMIAAIAVGWVAALFHASGHAPIGLTSLGVGAALRGAGALAANQHVVCWKRLVVGTLFLAGFTIVAEHAWLYGDFRRQWQDARTKSATVAMFRPETPPGPGEYFAHEFNAPLWIADAVLITGAALGTVILWQRQRK